MSISLQSAKIENFCRIFALANIFDDIFMRYIKLLILWMFASAVVQAQAVKTLPADPAVKSGVLPNGITYYIATNPSMKGVADFALVQKTGAATIPGVEGHEMIAKSQKGLTSLYRLSAPTVQEYFMNHGAVPGKNGFVQVTDNATVFRFENVMLGGSVVDSTLLVLMGMVEKAAQNDEVQMKDWFAPADHALIVSGDVDSKVLVEKMKMLSFMIPSQKSKERKKYEWVDSPEMIVRRLEGAKPGLFTIAVTWRVPRTPEELMNTVQPAIYEMFMSELGIIAGDRIRTSLMESGVPYADVSYDYLDGTESLGDEMFKMSVTVSQEDMNKAVAAVSSVFSGLDASYAHGSEVKRAGYIYKSTLKSRLKDMESNADYVDRCVSAFVFNSPLTSKKDLVAFHNSRDLPQEDELKIFNSIVSASLDGKCNLTLEYSTADKNVSDNMVANLFGTSWMAERAKDEAVVQNVISDDPATAPAEALKLKSSKKEYMSGGSVWTLSNGFKVIFKPMPADGKIYYSLALNGGYANIPDLNAGEGAYMSEILKLSRIKGIEFASFLDEIRRNGVTMRQTAGLSQFALSGMAPDDRIDYLLKALLAVMNDSKIDRDALDYYIKCERLRKKFLKGTIHERISYIDSTMCPGYRYSGAKDADGLTQEFASKAEKLMTELSGKMNDGMLILIGDIDEKKLKTALLTYAAGFRTDERTFARQTISYQPISGTIMRTVEGRANSVDMVMSVPMSLTADNYYVAAIASVALKNELTGAVSRTGMSLQIRHSFRKDPQERFSFMISLNEAAIDGFAPGTAVNDPLVALSAVKNALANPESLKISKEELDAYKALLKKHMSERKKNPEYWLHAITMRYLDSKDFTTGCDAKIDAVTADKVKALLASLVNGSKVEYIISRK